jgi:RNA polymerase sigma-70 factor, ECF subfamily
MKENSEENIREVLDEIYRTESRRILATLIRLLGDFDIAEDAMHDAFSAAIEAWQKGGMPANPRAWLISVGRFKAIDQIRHHSRFETPLDPTGEEITPVITKVTEWDEIELNDTGLEDDRLRLIFTCCHPALPPEARTVLTLREVCGLTTEQIAHAFLTTPPTLAKRIVRAKSKIREEHIPYEIPSQQELPARLDTVLQVIYLVFNEGYSASSGETVTRLDLSSEAIRLGRLLLELLPDSEVIGILALMLLQESRRAARTTPGGDIILLEDQDRSLWDGDMIEEGLDLAQRALSSRRFGPYTIQAAIAAVHAETSSAASTNWAEIVRLYDLLMRVNPSPVVELNRAVAVAMLDGPSAGLQLIDAIFERGELNEYHLAHAARAELYRRLGRLAEARASYERALRLTEQAPERRFLERKLRDLGN